MTIETDIERAQTCLRAEQEAIDAKLNAYETFISRVSKLQPNQTSSSAVGINGVGTTHLSTDGSSTDHCRMVRTAFAETIRPHSVADIDESESLLETIREEFSDTIAVTLAPATEASFSPELKQMVLSEAKSQRMAIMASRQALGKEESQLSDTAETAANITDWITTANETPLLSLGFDALKQRHEKLTIHRNRCEKLARERQEFLRKSTNKGIDAGIRHRIFILYLYQDLPVDHPVLATVAELDVTCKSYQQNVRYHLARRV